MGDGQATALVGTSGWDKPQWRGHFYPQGLPQRREFSYAAERLATFELNTTFHGLSPAENFPRWRAGTPPGTVFSVKGHKAVTHERRLVNTTDAVADFFASGLLGLQEKMGPMLWQVPPSLEFRPAVVEAFLASLPRTVGDARELMARHASGDAGHLGDNPARRIRHAFETRHPSFLVPAFAELLREHGVAAVFVNAPGRPVVTEVTADFVYIRLHSDAGHRPDGYDDDALDHWARLIEGWRSGAACPDGRGRDVVAYFDNPDHTRTSSPFDAIRLQQRLDGPAAGATRPETSILPPLWEE